MLNTVKQSWATLKQAQICAEGCKGVNLSLLTVSGGREVIELSLVE